MEFPSDAAVRQEFIDFYRRDKVGWQPGYPHERILAIEVLDRYFIRQIRLVGKLGCCPG